MFVEPSPICQSQGCMHDKHFVSIRKLQAEIEKLEKERDNWYCERCGCEKCLSAEESTEK